MTQDSDPVPAGLENPDGLFGADDDVITVRRGGPPDVIATIWYQLGYRPSESLVLVGLRPGSHRLGMISRLDLPARADAATRRAVIRALYGPVRATGARDVLAVIFSESLFSAARPPITVAAIRAEVSKAGGRVVDVIGVTATRFRSLGCGSSGCCPPEGFPIQVAQSSRAAVAHVLRGADVAACEADLVRDVQPVETGRDPGGPGGPGGSGGPGGPRGPLSPGSRRLQWLVWERALLAGEIPSGRAASLAPFVADPELRDALLATALGVDRSEVLAALAPSGPGVDLRAGLTRSPEDADQAARVERARLVFATAARHAAPGERGSVIALLAMLAWYRGQTARARLLADSALSDHHGNGLALLVQDLLATAAPPPWLPAPWAG